MSFLVPQRRRRVILVLVFLAVVVSYIDRQIVSVLKPTLKEVFDIDDRGFALCVSGGTIGAVAREGDLRSLRCQLIDTGGPVERAFAVAAVPILDSAAPSQQNRGHFLVQNFGGHPKPSS